MKEGEDMAKVIHVLSDGTVVDSIEGMVIPAGHPVYNIIAKARKAKKDEESKEDAKGA